VVEALVALVEEDTALVGPAEPEKPKPELDEVTLLPPAPDSVTTTES
jgi:hypothetical protein